MLLLLLLLLLLLFCSTDLTWGSQLSARSLKIFIKQILFIKRKLLDSSFFWQLLIILHFFWRIFCILYTDPHEIKWNVSLYSRRYKSFKRPRRLCISWLKRKSTRQHLNCFQLSSIFHCLITANLAWKELKLGQQKFWGS